MDEDQFIERRIILGCIISDDFIREIAKIWNPKYITSSAARLLAQWCLEFYAKYNRAPQQEIEGIYVQKLKEQQIRKEQGEDIEDILDGLNSEYEGHNFNVEYLSIRQKSIFKTAASLFL